MKIGPRDSVLLYRGPKNEKEKFPRYFTVFFFAPAPSLTFPAPFPAVPVGIRDLACFPASLITDFKLKNLPHKALLQIFSRAPPKIYSMADRYRLLRPSFTLFPGPKNTKICPQFYSIPD